jgi:hypothetical protein
MMSRDLSFKIILVLAAQFTYLSTSGTLAQSQNENCIRIKDCPVAISHLKNIRNDPKSVAVLQKAHCGFAGREPIVRCSSIPRLPTSSDNSECVPLQDCPAAVRLVRTRVFDPAVVNLFRSIHCGETKQQPMIYCQRVTLR